MCKLFPSLNCDIITGKGLLFKDMEEYLLKAVSVSSVTLCLKILKEGLQL